MTSSASLPDTLLEKIENLETEVKDHKTSLTIASSKVEDFEKKIDTTNREIQVLHEARQLLLEASRISRERTIGNVERTVTLALRVVFDDPSLAFKINLTERRGALEADFLVRWEEKGGVVEDNPMTAKGGSLVDVISTALKVVLLNTHRPRKRKLLILDEPGKWLSPARRYRFGRWLSHLSRDIGIQVLMVTHDSELKGIADRSFTLTRHGREPTQIEVSDNVEDVSGYGGISSQGES